MLHVQGRCKSKCALLRWITPHPHASTDPSIHFSGRRMALQPAATSSATFTKSSRRRRVTLTGRAVSVQTINNTRRMFFACNVFADLLLLPDSEEDRKKYLDQAMTARAKRFEAVIPLVRLQDEAMDIISRKLAIARKILASPHLLYRMHGVAAPPGTVSAADAVSPGAQGSLDLPDFPSRRLTVAMARGPVQAARRNAGTDSGPDDDDDDDDLDSDTDEDVDQGATGPASGWQRLWLNNAARRRAGSGGVSESKGDDSSWGRAGAAVSSSLAAHGRATASAGAAMPLLQALRPPPEADPRIEFEIAVERRRLDTLILAYEALSEFHRVEKW